MNAPFRTKLPGAAKPQILNLGNKVFKANCFSGYKLISVFFLLGSGSIIKYFLFNYRFIKMAVFQNPKSVLFFKFLDISIILNFLKGLPSYADLKQTLRHCITRP